jgi:hypothetical protein
MKRKDLLIVFFIFVLAYFLRVFVLSQKALTFGYDQARDAYVTQQIINGDLKILGPPASTPGLYHGVFYYYFLVPAYLLGKSPINAAYWVAFFNAAAVFIVFYLTYLLTNKKLSAFLAGFLFAISFEATQYATWLSNPTIAVWTVPLMYLGLWVWINNKKSWGPILAALGLGLSIQAEIFLLYHTVPLLIWLIAARKKINRNQLLAFGFSLLVTISTLIVSEIKFGFRGLSGMKQLLISQQTSLAYAKSLGDYLVLYLNQIGRIFAFNSYPGNIGYGGAFILGLVFLGLYQWNRKKIISWQPFLATWLLSHITVVTVGGMSTPFLMVGIGPAVSIIVAIFLANWWRKKYKVIVIVVLGLMIFGNISMIFRENPQGATLFAIQKDMVLSKQLKAIDYTYKQANGEAFSINSLTSPLWINIVWTYLYEWYGKSEYGYVPTWHGRDQIGQLASLPKLKEDINNYFLIIEPMGGIPMRYLKETIDEEDTRSIVLDEKYFGELRVQKRRKL